MKKPDYLCSHDGCIRPAKWMCEMYLHGTPLKGHTSLRVCSQHRAAAEAFITNDDNRTRLANTIIREGIADPFTAYGLAKHNVVVSFDRLQQPPV